MSNQESLERTYQVGPDTYVRLGYSVYDADGEAVDGGTREVEFVFGYGQLLPALERAIEGQRPGARRSVRLKPDQAYGKRDPSRIVEVARDEFPEDVGPGDRFEAENAEGALVVLKVLEVLPDAVVLDTNHPLADQEIRFELTVESVRPATAGEIEGAVQRIENGAKEPTAEALIDPRSLIRGQSRG